VPFEWHFEDPTEMIFRRPLKPVLYPDAKAPDAETTRRSHATCLMPHLCLDSFEPRFPHSLSLLLIPHDWFQPIKGVI
jgi:hypothetical protein